MIFRGPPSWDSGYDPRRGGNWGESVKKLGSRIRMVFSSSCPPLGISGHIPRKDGTVGKWRWGWGLGSRLEAMHNGTMSWVFVNQSFVLSSVRSRELSVLYLVTTVCELKVGLQILPHLLFPFASPKP